MKVWLRRRWCPPGVRPPWEVADRYQWRWLYAAIDPVLGQGVFLLLPRVDTVCTQLFLDHLAQTLRSSAGPGAAEAEEVRVGLVWDGSGAHRANDLVWPTGMEPIPLPPYSPELNPAEQVMRMVRSRLANRIFEDEEELDEAMSDVLRDWWAEPATLRRLTGYHWWLEAVATITSSIS
jgi:putative transposase